MRLLAGQLCAACEAHDSWARHGGRLVLDRRTIDEAVERRRGASREPGWRRLAVWFAPSVTLGVGAAAVWTLVDLLSPRAIGPLAALLAALTSAWKRTLLAGAVAIVLGTAALLRGRRTPHFRRIAHLTCHLAAIAVGAAAVLLATCSGLVATRGFAGAHSAMPPRVSLGLPAHFERIADATVVVLAPDADGDARGGAIGSGAVVAAESDRAWILTCSHVAMPYIAPAAPRRSRDARPVWIQLSDGREGQGRVAWAAPPPLDIVLIELAVDDPPLPVPIALDASAMIASAAVAFVPNPYRSGWKLLRGQVIGRETHNTPAGAFDLVLTDLPVTFGDSGSGLYDERGRLVGLNTWSRMGDGPAQGLSLPSEAMRAAIEAIRTGRLDQLEPPE